MGHFPASPTGPFRGRRQARALEAAADDDRKWFATHPHRSHRLRLAIADEWAEIGGRATHTIVRQAMPGLRFKVPIAATNPLPSDEAPEALAWALFDLVRENTQHGDAPISVDEVMARCRKLGAGGRA
jgi:hypothetical protein